MTLSPTLPGRQGRIATTLPNWRQPVEVSYEFKTGMATSREGHEQRWASRQKARVTIQFGTALGQKALQRHMADMADSLHAPFTLVAPWRKVELASDAILGATDLDITDPPFWLVPGSHVVLAAPDFWEAAEVASVAGNTVTLTSGTVRAYDAGTRLYGAYMARAPEESRFQAETSRVWTSRMVYEVDPGTDPQAIPAASPDTFEGREVFLTKPNWATPPTVSFLELREMVDPGYGVVESDTPTGRTQIELSLSYLGLSAAKAEDLIAMFLRQKGKRGEFWMPTWQDDLTPLGTVSSGSSTFDVAGEDAFYAFNGSDLYNVVIARWGGGYQINRVTGLAISGTDTRFTFADPWSVDLDEAVTVSWCPLWRFATDKLDVSRRTDEVAQITFSLISLRNEAP